jgi:hypothetical protein
MIGMGAKSITIVRAVTADFFFDCRAGNAIKEDCIRGSPGKQSCSWECCLRSLLCWETHSSLDWNITCSDSLPCSWSTVFFECRCAFSLHLAEQNCKSPVEKWVCLTGTAGCYGDWRRHCRHGDAEWRTSVCKLSCKQFCSIPRAGVGVGPVRLGIGPPFGAHDQVLDWQLLFLIPMASSLPRNWVCSLEWLHSLVWSLNDQ